jgi:hypothetical protein
MKWRDPGMLIAGFNLGVGIMLCIHGDWIGLCNLVCAAITFCVAAHHKCSFGPPPRRDEE